jgi:hypothetical protein
VVEENQIGIAGGSDTGDLLDFASTDERGRVWTGTPLHYFSGYACSCAVSELAKLRKGLLSIEGRNLAEGLGRN